MVLGGVAKEAVSKEVTFKQSLCEMRERVPAERSGRRESQTDAGRRVVLTQALGCAVQGASLLQEGTFCVALPEERSCFLSEIEHASWLP